MGSQKKEIVNILHKWNDEDIEKHCPLILFELAPLLCENSSLLDKISLCFVVDKLIETTGIHIDEVIYSRSGSNLMRLACKPIKAIYSWRRCKCT